MSCFIRHTKYLDYFGFVNNFFICGGRKTRARLNSLYILCKGVA